MNKWRLSALAAIMAATTYTFVLFSNNLTDKVAAAAAATPLVVNTTDDIDDGACDSAHCSLREAVQQSNDNIGPDEIIFEPSVFPLSGSGVIALDMALPQISDGYTVIDAAGAQVTIDGRNLAGAETHGFYIAASSHNTIRGLRMQNMPGAGIIIAADRAGAAARHNRVINCTVLNNAAGGISLVSHGSGEVDHNVVSGNLILGNAEAGIGINAQGPGSASYNLVSNNTIEGADLENNGGIALFSHGGGSADGNIITGNVVDSARDWGIRILTNETESSASENLLFENTVKNVTGCAVEINPSRGAAARLNRIFHNNLIDNDFCQALDNGRITSWDFEGKGNFWSDYTGTDEDGDGIGDSPYQVSPDVWDSYPLMAPYGWQQVYLPFTVTETSSR